MKIHQISQCRICGNEHLVEILSLGNQVLTGIFPKSQDEAVPSGPLELVKCHGENACHLVQLRHSFEADQMYGMNYGYRSGLNSSMVAHLKEKAAKLQKLNPLTPDDLVLDVGSNDGTSLSFYPGEVTRVGMDPTIVKFGKFYQPGINAIPEFFSASSFRAHYGDRKAKIISSIAMFYDLEEPMKFVKDIAEVIADDGIWHFEQSYMPLMMERNAYDTICHEHVEYYALYQIQWMLERCGLRILDVELNDINGGSFTVTACKEKAHFQTNKLAVESMRSHEHNVGITTLAPYDAFKTRVFKHRDELKSLVSKLIAEGSTIMGYGASTKGNVLLQFCEFTQKDLKAVAEVNPDKFGTYTPGTKLPIISETEAHGRNPDYFLVLPWHFRDNLISRERKCLEEGGKMIFPLPEIEIVGG
jgi:hypothetical protein